jgi:hypothetical protein
LSDPETVFGFDGGLAGDVLASEGLVWRQPGGCIFVALCTVGGAIGSHEVQCIIGEFLALVCVELLRALLPGVAEGDNVVDLDVGAGVLATDKVDGCTGVLVDQRSGGDYTIVGTRLERFVGQIPGEDVIAGVAAVAVRVSPGRSKLITCIASLRGPAFYRDALQLFERVGCVYRGGRPGSDAGVRFDGLKGVGCSVTTGQRGARRRAVTAVRALTAERMILMFLRFVAGCSTLALPNDWRW